MMKGLTWKFLPFFSFLLPILRNTFIIYDGMARINLSLSGKPLFNILLRLNVIC